MNNFILKSLGRLFFIGITGLSVAQGQHFQESICKISHLESKAHQKKLTFKSHGLHNNYDVKYHSARWKIDPAVRYIEGNIYTVFKVGNTAIDTLYFDLSSDLTVDDVLYQGTSVSFTHLSNDLLEIRFPGSISAGALDSLVVHYHGVPPSTGFGSYVQTVHQGAPIIWTLSEPYGAKDWWPCKQSLNDKIDSIDIFIECPVGNKAAGNGTLESTQLLPGPRILYHWKHRFPIPAYLVATAVTNYAAYSNYANLTLGNVEILNYVYPEDSASAYLQTSAMIPVMELFDTLIEPYPYSSEKYGHAQFSWGGGMEHTTMSFMAGFNHGLMAHELAHQWFGDKVTCGSWSDIWLNEGFATYMEGLTYEHLFNGQLWPVWKRAVINNILSAPDGSVYVSDTTSVSRIFDGRLSYSKGAMLLHMLRWKLGDEDFFQGVRNYLADPSLAFSFARTNDLKHHLELASGTNLTPFFDDWFYGEGFPVYKILWDQTGNDVSVKISQTTTHSSVTIFEMPVSLRFKGNGGDTTLVFEHLFNDQVFTSSLNFQVDSVFFDPGIWLVADFLEPTKVPGLGLNEESDEDAISLYPNPASSYLNLEGCWQRACLYDQAGKMIKDIQRSEPACDPGHISLEDIAPGIYFIRVNNSVHKIVHW